MIIACTLVFIAGYWGNHFVSERVRILSEPSLRDKVSSEIEESAKHNAYSGTAVRQAPISNWREDLRDLLLDEIANLEAEGLPDGYATVLPLNQTKSVMTVRDARKQYGVQLYANLDKFIASLWWSQELSNYAQREHPSGLESFFVESELWYKMAMVDTDYLRFLLHRPGQMKGVFQGGQLGGRSYLEGFFVALHGPLDTNSFPRYASHVLYQAFDDLLRFNRPGDLGATARAMKGWNQTRD